MNSITNLHCILLLDESSSMSVMKNETIASVSRFIEEQKTSAKETGTNVFFTLVKFASDVETLFRRVPLETVDKVDYNPSGFTALYKAIGTVITENENETANVVFVILTDGENTLNDSTFNQQCIAKMIDVKTKAGWKFLFLGANQDQFSSDASKIGLTQQACYFSMTPANLKTAMRSASQAATDYVKVGVFQTPSSRIFSQPPPKYRAVAPPSYSLACSSYSSPPKYKSSDQPKTEADLIWEKLSRR